MYQVSNAYKEQIEKEMRNYSFIKIHYGLSDPDAPDASTLTDDGHLVSSKVSDILEERTAIQFYTTLEPNRFVLDGHSVLTPSTANYNKQGYISDELSNANGIYENQPTITITFNDYFEFPGLIFIFDEIGLEHPTKIGVVAYNDDVVVHNVDIDITSAEFTYMGQIPLHNKLEIIFKESIPYRRARLQTLIYGIQETLTERNLTEASIETEIDPITTKLPTVKVSFTRQDPNNKYDPENSSGLWKYLEEGQEVNVSLGYQLDDGSIEWVQMSRAYTNGEVKVSGNKKTASVTFNAIGRINQMTDEYTEGKYYADGRSMYDLAMDVATYGGFAEELVLDESLRNISTKVPLPVKPINECLQLIANASCMTLSIGRDGSTQIKPLSTDTQTFTFDFNNMLGVPVTKKYPYLKTLSTIYQNVVVATELTDLASNVEVSGANETLIEIEHSCSTEHSVTLTGDLVASSTTHFAYKTQMVLTGTGTVTIKGKAITFNGIGLALIFNQVGQNLELSNELIDDRQRAILYANWVGTDIQRQNEYTITHRGYPELDSGDFVSMQTNYSDNTPVQVLSNKTTYNGALQGSAKLLIKNGGV